MVVAIVRPSFILLTAPVQVTERIIYMKKEEEMGQQ